MASGYEKSPDYGGPEPWLGGWFAVAVGILALAALVGLTLWATGAFNRAAAAENEAFHQRIYCAGMATGHRLPSGGFVDCLSDEYAIEVDWAHKWAEAVGQSLYYAAETNRKPGIILLCRSSSQRDEGLCRSYLYRLEAALRFVSAKVTVWECFVDSDEALGDCFVPALQ